MTDTIAMPALTRISLPNVLGVAWVGAESKTRYQLFTFRPSDTPRVTFAMSVDGISWTSSPIVNAERFGALPIRTMRDMVEYARLFITTPVKGE